MERIASKGGKARWGKKNGPGLALWPIQEVSHPQPPQPHFAIAMFSLFAKEKMTLCRSKVNLSGVNGNETMSGWEDDNPDNERREADNDYTQSVSRRSDGSASGAGIT